MPLRDAPVLLVGSILQQPAPVYEYDSATNRRTDKVRAMRVIVLSDATSGEVGATDVTVPIADLTNYNLRIGSSVCWWVRFGSYVIDGRGGGTCSAISPAVDGAAELVHSAMEHMAGSSADGGRRAAPATA